MTFSGKVIYYNYKVREREKKEGKEMLVVYMLENGGLEIELYCEVETEEAGWEIANEMNQKQDGFIYWVEEK